MTANRGRIESGRLNRSQGKQRGMLKHGSSAANQHDSAGTLGLDGGFIDSVQIVHVAQDFTFAHALSQIGDRNEESVDWRRVMDLQVRLLGIARGASALALEGSGRPLQAPDGMQQIFEAPVQRLEVSGFDAASALALGIDGGNVAGISSTQGATRKKRARPTPVIVEAGSHRFLFPRDRAGSGEVAYPRHERAGGSSTVQVDVVGGLAEHLGVEQIGQLRRDFAARFTRKGPGEVAAVDRMTSLGGIEGRFIQYGDHDDRTMQTVGAPGFHPLPQGGGAFIFIPMGGGIDQQDGTGPASPDPGFEPHFLCLHASLVKTQGEGGDI